MTAPLTRAEVEAWPALGPMNLDARRVLELLDRAEKTDALLLVLADVDRLLVAVDRMEFDVQHRIIALDTVNRVCEAAARVRARR